MPAKDRHHDAVVRSLIEESILSEDIGQQVIWAASIRLVVFDPDKEDIVQWIP